MKKTFCPMVPALKIARDSRLTLCMMRVLLAMYQFADRQGECKPKAQQIADAAGVTERKARAATAALARIGWLEKAAGGGRGKPTGYRITEPETLPESGTLSEPPIVNVHTSTSSSCDDDVSHQARDARAPEQQEHPVTEHNFTLTSEPQRKARKGSAPAMRPDDVTEETWEDWCALRKRKKAPITEGVIMRAREEAKKANMSLEEFLKEWVYRGSQGFYADWIKKPAQQQNGYKSAAQIRSEESQKQWDAIKNYSSTRSDAMTIDTPSAQFRETQLQLLENAK